MLVRDGYGFFLNAKGYNARVIAEWLLGKLISLNVHPIPNGIILDDRIRLCEVAMTFGWSSLYLWNIFWNKNATLILNPADSFPFKERHLSLLWTQWTSLKVSVARQQTPWAVRRWVAGILNLPWWEFCLISIIHLIAEKSVSCLRSESEASSLETAGRSFLLAYRQLNDISMRTGVFSFSFVFNIFDLTFDIQNFASRTKRLSWVLIPKWHDPWINLLWILCGVCFASVLQNVLRWPRASMPFQSEAFCHVLQDYVLKLRALMIKRFFGALSPKKILINNRCPSNVKVWKCHDTPRTQSKIYAHLYRRGPDVSAERWGYFATWSCFTRIHPTSWHGQSC